LVKQFSGAGLLTELNGELFFSANDGAHGRELWKSDGTATGTVMVSDIYSGAGGSKPAALTRVGNDLYFTADDGAAGRELWKYDGATTLVKDINPGSADSLDLPQITNVNGQIYFVADAGSGSKIWQSDGTGAGTMLVPSAAGQPEYSNPDWLVAMNNKLCFAASDPIHGRELWDPPAVQSPEPLGALEEQLFVADFGKDSVFRYDADTGEFVDRFVPHGSGGLNQPYGAIFGPDGNGDGERDLYVSSGVFGATGQPKVVYRYDGLSGEFIDTFTKGGDMTSPRGIIFTPDGDLLVADRTAGDTFPLGRVARFDGATGQYEGDFVTLGSGGYALPQGLVFGPSIHNPNKMDLYASSADTNAVLRFDGETGEFLGQFVATDSGGLDHPLGLTFGPGGDLYVVSTFDNPIIARFQGPSGKNPGAFVETFVPADSGGMLNPVALIFGPDGNGDGHQDLYVTNSLLQKSLQAKDGSVKRYDGQTGAFIDTIVATKSGGLDDPIGLTFRNTDSVTLEYTGPDAADGTVLIAVEHVVSANYLNSLSVNDSVQIQSDGTTDPSGLPARNIANLDNTQSFMSVPAGPLSIPLPVGRSTAHQVDAEIHDGSLADDWNRLLDDPLLDLLAGELLQA
jgi:ELWxxDGT repeat protein